MLEKLKNIFICNGFEPDEIREIRNQLVDTTIDGLKKLSLGMGVLYVLAVFFERRAGYVFVDFAYLFVLTLFLLMVNVFQRTGKYTVAELATVFFVIAVLSVAIYDSTVLCQDSRGVFFPLFMVLIAVMFTGNPLVIDILMFLMTVIYCVVSFRVKEPAYYEADFFIGAYALMISNMVNAMISRSRISRILKTNEVEKSRHKYEILYNTISCGIMEYQMEQGKQKLLSINQTGLQLLGDTEEELKAAENLDLIHRTHPDDMGQVIHLFENMKAVGDRESYEYRIKQKNGGYVWIVGQVQVTNVEEDKITMLSTCIDVNAEKKAIYANEAKSKFLSRMSHDIRTPMNAIIGLTDIVLDNPDLDNPTRENMKSIKSSSNFLLGLINDVLDVSKIEADEMILHPEPYLKDEFVDYLNTMIRPLCEKKGIRFVVDTQSTTYSYVMLDKVRFNQIFFNLLSNAVKFTPPGGTVTVKVAHNGKMDEQKHLIEHITISDTGIGMSQEFQKHMFEAFAQENTAHVNESQGTGLGLSIVKRVVALMNGKMEVRSAPGQGTTFDIYLSLEVCEGPKAQKAEYDPQVLEGKKVLVCEDHPINRQITEVLLKKAGMKTEFAVDGVQGVSMFLESHPGYYDAVLMDIRMPNMGGLEATGKIREAKRKDGKTIPIIAMTANVFDTDRKASMDAGMNDHIAKPLEPMILYTVLAQQIQNRNNQYNV